MTGWSSSWKASKQPRKQRNYVRNAPLHTVSKLSSSHLSKELKQKLNQRSIRIRKGDKVKVLRGQFKGKTGTVERVNTMKQRVYITGIEFSKKDGSKTLYPINTSNILVQEIDTTDKKRIVGEKK